MVRPKLQQTQMNKATRRAAVSPPWTAIKCKAGKARQKPNIPPTPLANTAAVVSRPALAYKTADMLSQTIGMTATNPAISGPIHRPVIMTAAATATTTVVRKVTSKTPPLVARVRLPSKYGCEQES